MWWKREMHIGFSGTARGKSSLKRPRRRGEDDIKMDLKEMGWKGVEWTHLA